MNEYEVSKGVALLSAIARAMAERGIAPGPAQWIEIKRGADEALESWRRRHEGDGAILSEKAAWNIYGALGRLAAGAIRSGQLDPSPESTRRFLIDNATAILKAARDIVLTFPDAAGTMSMTNLRPSAMEALRVALSPSQVAPIVSASEHLVGRPPEHPATKAVIEHAIGAVIDRVDDTARKLLEGGIRGPSLASQVRGAAFEAMDLAAETLRNLRQDPSLYPERNSAPLMDRAIRKMERTRGRTPDENDLGDLSERIARAINKRFDAAFSASWTTTEALNAQLAAALSGKKSPPPTPRPQDEDETPQGHGGTAPTPTTGQDKAATRPNANPGIHKAFGTPARNGPSHPNRTQDKGEKDAAKSMAERNAENDSGNNHTNLQGRKFR